MGFEVFVVDVEVDVVFDVEYEVEDEVTGIGPAEKVKCSNMVVLCSNVAIPNLDGKW